MTDPNLFPTFTQGPKKLYARHGFRSTFRDWAAEEAYTFANETIELALAHAIKNKAEAAYRRGDQLERRRELMTAWSEYIDEK